MQTTSDNIFLTKPKAWRFKKSALVHTNPINSTAHEDGRERTPYYTHDLD